MGIGVLVVVVVIIVLLSAPSLLGMAPNASSEVARAFDGHLQRIESLNATSVLQEYTDKATTAWKGVAGGYAGIYSSTKNISALYRTFLSGFSKLTISNVTDSVTTKGNVASVKGLFRIGGLITPAHSGCPTTGNFSGTVEIAVTFVRVDGAWLLSSETWNFIYPFSSGICA